ncbi:MAG: radical SAM protein [Alphaproteobacteria bacterium]
MHRNVYSSLKFFHHPDRMEALAAGRHLGPLHVRIKPTNVCNHDCYFCAYRSDGLSLGSTMQVRDRIPQAKMKEIVEDLIAIGTKAVTFSGGGEPLLYPHLAESAERLAGAGIGIGVLTNGSQLRGRLAQTLARTASWVRVSIDGWDSASYARNRNVPLHSFERVLENMAAFSKMDGDCTLGASVIVDSGNAEHLFDLAQRLKSAGAEHVKLSPCIVSESAAGNAAHHRQFANVVRSEIARCQTLAASDFAVVDHYHFEPDPADEMRHPHCPMTRLLTVIGADCSVYTCQDKAYTDAGRIGTIQDRRFSDLWLDDSTVSWLDNFDARTCTHHCVAATKNRLLNDFIDVDRSHVAFV